MSYQNVVLADSPVRYHRLGESSGTVATDIGSQAQNGTLHGTITLSQPGVLKSDPNTSMLFDGSTGYISLPTTGLPTGSSAVTIECWVQFPSVPSAGAYGVALALGSAVLGQDIALYYGDGSQHLSAASKSIGFVQGPLIIQNTPYHCVLTYDGATATFYVNGVSQGTLSFTASLTYGVAYIGQDPGGGAFFAGVLDEGAIYSGALSSTRVQAHYTAGRTNFLHICDGYGGVFS